MLQQESNAKKIVIAQYNDQKRLYPFITHGYSPQESNELVAKLDEAAAQGRRKDFCPNQEYRRLSICEARPRRPRI